MSRYHSYINSAVDILSAYKGEEPFASFLKKYFAQHKKFGSKDRKQVGHLCYSYFRLGKSLTGLPTEERILLALFLCASESNDILKELKPGWNEKVQLPVDEKIKLTGHQFAIHDIFPWQNELSEDVGKEVFTLSHLQQPDLFLRLRPGKEQIVIEKLEKVKIEYKAISENCIALPNASKIDELIEVDREAVIQDLSSQRVGEFLQLVKRGPSDKLWDCCAASGGKSIMAKDLLGDIDLTVSDIRESILVNLKKRFEKAGIQNYHSYVLDLEKENAQYAIPGTQYSIILADVPCSGSGTWGRTPEQLFYFDEVKIDAYAALQRKIVSNIIPRLAPDGYLLYITCSVFKKENEDNVHFIKEKFQLQLLKMELLKGYAGKADTMFTALLKKSL